ncbi:CHASE domain-containing protein [Litoreibacter albidus]|uniref:CHASE domain-containing protein n=1 Tax=Litoreibacter albidus TaxID=670155 RepID=UPI00373556E3
MTACVLATLAVASWFNNDQKKRTSAVFETITEDNKDALSGRLSDYRQALTSAAGFYMASDKVTQEDWRKYVEALTISEALPGVSGLGIILPVETAKMDEFRAGRSDFGQPNFQVRPESNRETAYVITYIEPMSVNAAAIGLDIGFEKRRREAAIKARDTKSPQLTERILLVQDETSQPGFLLVNPIIGENDVFIGWSYLPFVGGEALKDMTAAQTEQFWLTVYDGTEPDGDMVIYDESPEGGATSAFTRSAVVPGMGQEWLMVWSSTPKFEAGEAQLSTWFTLALGLMVTALVGLLTASLLQRERAVRILVAQKTRELKARERQTSSIVDNAMAAILLLDGEQRIVTANKTTGEMFELDEQALIGKPLQCLIGGLDITAHDDATRIKAETSSGTKLLLDGRFSSWDAIDGSTQSVAILQDVTEEETSKQRLGEAEERWNKVLIGAEIGVFDLDLRTGKSIVSGMWKQLMGIPEATSDVDTQQAFLDRIHPDDLAALQEADQACISGKTQRSVAQYRMRFGEDEWRWMRSDAVVAGKDENGVATRLIGAQTDITELREAQERLEHSEQRFKSVLAHAPVGMALCSAQGDFLGVNDALCDLTGFSEEYLQTKKLSDIVVREDFRNLHSNVRELQKNNEHSLKSECRIVTREGGIKWGLVGVAWTYNDELDEEMFILQVQDINELKNVEKMKAQFVSTVSHELRTPLTSIKGALSLLEGQYAADLAGPANRLVKIAQQNGDRLIDLVNDILDMEKISSGQSDFVFSNENINTLVQLAVEQLEPFAHQHNTTIKGKYPPISPAAYVDPRRLQQVVANFISNAAKYSCNDSVINVSVERLDGNLRVKVCNIGPGIPESFVPKVFMAFQQADSSDTRSNGGTGLGLNISKQIIDHMGGEIGFDSVVDGETCFWFTLPEIESAAVVAANLQEHQLEDQKPIEILHLEDDEDFAEIVRNSFGGFAKVTSVGTLAGARRKIRDFTYDLVIIDWELPDGRGDELLSGIEENQKNIPIFGLSAYEGKVKSDLVVADLVKSRADLTEVVTRAIKSVERFRRAEGDPHVS